MAAARRLRLRRKARRARRPRCEALALRLERANWCPVPHNEPVLQGRPSYELPAHTDRPDSLNPDAVARCPTRQPLRLLMRCSVRCAASHATHLAASKMPTPNSPQSTIVPFVRLSEDYYAVRSTPVNATGADRRRSAPIDDDCHRPPGSGLWASDSAGSEAKRGRYPRTGKLPQGTGANHRYWVRQPPAGPSSNTSCPETAALVSTSGARLPSRRFTPRMGGSTRAVYKVTDLAVPLR